MAQWVLGRRFQCNKYPTTWRWHSVCQVKGQTVHRCTFQSVHQNAYLLSIALEHPLKRNARQVSCKHGMYLSGEISGQRKNVFQVSWADKKISFSVKLDLFPTLSRVVGAHVDANSISGTPVANYTQIDKSVRAITGDLRRAEGVSFYP